MMRKMCWLVLALGMAFVVPALFAGTAGAGECDEKWESCVKRCTKKTLAAEGEEFEALVSANNDCDAACDAKAAKCLMAAAGNERNNVRKVLKQRAKVYAKSCGRRYDKILAKCRSASKDLKALKSCYKKRARPMLLECYAQVDKDLPLPGESGK